MIETSHQALATMWRKLAQRNKWQLVHDEDAFLEQVAVEFAKLTNVKTLHSRQEMAIQRTYSLYLYRGVQQRQDQAFDELGHAFRRTAMKDGSTPTEAEELAHAAIYIILEKIGAVRSPESFLTWAFTAFREARRKQWKAVKQIEPFASNADDETTFEPADPQDQTVHVDQKIAATQTYALLRAAVRNEQECEIVWRIEVNDDSISEVAHDLGLTEQQLRTIKHRTLKRLRKNSKLYQQLRMIAGTATTNSGVPDEEQATSN